MLLDKDPDGRLDFLEAALLAAQCKQFTRVLGSNAANCLAGSREAGQDPEIDRSLRPRQ
jgi:hypothetical protein